MNARECLKCWVAKTILSKWTYAIPASLIYIYGGAMTESVSLYKASVFGFVCWFLFLNATLLGGTYLFVVGVMNVVKWAKETKRACSRKRFLSGLAQEKKG